MTQTAMLLRALVEAGDRGLSFQEIVALGVPGRFVDTRMRALQGEHEIRAVESRFRRFDRRGRELPARIHRWVYVRPKGPIVEAEPVLEPTLLQAGVGVSPAAALTADMEDVA